MSMHISTVALGAGTIPNGGLPQIQISTRQITYGEIFKRVEDEITADLVARDKPLKRVANFRTARNGWMKEFGFSESSPVGVEFGSDFTACVERYSDILGAEGKSSQTIADRRSILGVYREAWVEMLQENATGDLEGDFAEVLSGLVEKSGIPVWQLLRDSGVKPGLFAHWRRGEIIPSTRYLPAVHKLETLFGLPCGALAAKLPHVMFGELGRMKTGLTPYRKHLCGINSQQYLLKEFPPSLQAEWNDLYLFYTDAAWLRTRGLQRNSKWRVREHDNQSPTAEIARRRVLEVFGYLTLPPNEENPRLGGKGFEPAALTLALFSDSEVIYGYLQFKKERTYLKSYNAATHHLLILCLALLRPQTGFLWQSPEYGAKLPRPVPASEWHDWCKRHRSVLKSTLDDLVKEDEIKKTRDPFEPIRAIIVNNQHPLDSLFELADAYEADAPPRNASPQKKAIHYQCLFLIKFATLIPLRAFNFTVMTWRQDGTGNLYQKPDGSWWVRFGPSYLKNHKGAAKNSPFDVPLHESLYSCVEKYLFVHRPHLLGAGECDYVFRPGRPQEVTKTNRAGQTVERSFLSAQVRLITQRYVPNCPGFGLHAFRHLAATEYVKNNPAGYAVAAAVLHDREETIKRNYAWVLPADKFGFWNEYVSRLIKRGEDENSNSTEVTKK